MIFKHSTKHYNLYNNKRNNITSAKHTFPLVRFGGSRYPRWAMWAVWATPSCPQAKIICWRLHCPDVSWPRPRRRCWSASSTTATSECWAYCVPFGRRWTRCASCRAASSLPRPSTTPDRGPNALPPPCPVPAKGKLDSWLVRSSGSLRGCAPTPPVLQGIHLQTYSDVHV